MTERDRLFARWNDRIAPQDAQAMRRAKAHWDGIAKPLCGLGKLETAIIRMAGITGDERVSIDKRAVAVLCADNGVVEEGVTQTDASVTAVMAKTANADVFAADFGMNTRADGVIDLHVANGTQNMANGPAMTEAEALRAIENGVQLADTLARQGYRILATGEMGIGNTSTSAAIAAVLLDLPVDTVTGRGAGLSDEGLLRKRAAIRKAIAINKPDPSDAFDVLRKVGGFDLAGLCGLYIGAAINRIPVIVDGLPSSVAALVAAKLVPNCAAAMLASHCSAEPVAKVILSELGLDAILYADMKLGEGTGAVCLLPLLDAALAVYHGSVSFSETGIAQYVPQKGDPR